MQLTLQIPDDLAADLRPREGRLPHILSLGLRELDAQGAAGFAGLADVLELLPQDGVISSLGLETPDETCTLELLRQSLRVEAGPGGRAGGGGRSSGRYPES